VTVWFWFDRESGRIHIHDHDVEEEEVIEILDSKRMESFDRQGNRYTIAATEGAAC
jgi:hypothetical protein